MLNIRTVSIFAQLYLFIFISIIPAQETEVDSLENLLKKYSDSDTNRIRLLNEIAYKVYSSDIQKTFDYSSEALKISENIGFPKGKAEALRLQGIYYLIKSDMEKSLELIEQSYQLNKKIGYKKGMSGALLNLGVISIRAGEENKALEYYKEAIQITEELGDILQAAKVSMNTGVIYYYRGDYPRTLEYYQKALKLYEEAGNKEGILSVLNNIAIIYRVQKDIKEAQNYNFRALAIAGEIGAKYQQASILMAIGVNYEAEGKPDSALVYHQRSLEMNNELKDKREISTVLSNMASIYITQGKTKKASGLIDKAIKLNKEINDPERLCNSYIIKGRLFKSAGDYSNAVNFANKAKKIANELDNPQYIQQSAEILAEAYGKLGEYKLAYENHVLFKNYSDSLFNESNIKEITRLENQYQFDKEKQEIKAEQHKKDLLHDEEVKREKIVRNSFILGFALMLVLAVVVYRNMVQKRKANETLARQKDELKKAHDKLLELDRFKEDMTGMIVHDLKNPLNAIINVSPSLTLDKQIHTLKQSGKQMLNMVMNILDVYKYEDTGMVLDKSNYSCYELVNSAINDVSFLAENNNIEIINNVEKTLGVEVDKSIIERVITNLLTNGIKYTPPNGSVTIESVQSGDNSGKVRIKVTDTGQGIPKDKLHKIFDKFAQIKARSSGRVRSTGLGLTFCKMAIEAHDCEIFVESVEGKGSSFIIDLPQGAEVAANENQVKEKTAKNIIELSDSEKEKIKPFLNEMDKLLVYESSKITHILNNLDISGSPNLKLWKEEMSDCLYYMNEDCYYKLLSLAKEKKS